MKETLYTSTDSICKWVFEFASFGIILTDTELNVTAYNKWIENHTDRKGIRKGKSLFDNFPEIKERGLDKHVYEALSGKSLILSARFHDYFLRFSSGIEDEYELMKQTVNISPLTFGEEISGIIIHIEDVTERTRREELLQKKNEELIRLNSTKDKFFRIISHDLRSPFNALIGFSELLRDVDNLTTEKTNEIVNILNTALKNQYTFLENLLKWSQLQSGQYELTFTDIRLSDIIDHILKIAGPAIQSKEIEIDITPAAGNIYIKTDANALTTILYNLIFNALKFTNNGGIIEVNAFIEDDALIIYVRDNGIGISEDRINRLFRIDESVSTPGTNKEKGSGLGLILVKELIEKLNGEIWVNSSPGNGSTFYISLPLYTGSTT
jgi:signal transduction histidine kinase